MCLLTRRALAQCKITHRVTLVRHASRARRLHENQQYAVGERLRSPSDSASGVITASSDRRRGPLAALGPMSVPGRRTGAICWHGGRDGVEHQGRRLSARRLVGSAPARAEGDVGRTGRMRSERDPAC
jgi:hypothetical protein